MDRHFAYNFREAMNPCFRARFKVTEANLPLTCSYFLHTFLGSFCCAPSLECCEGHFKWEPRKAGSASTPARESTEVAWQWWWPEGKDKEKDGGPHVLLPFPPRRSLWELCSKLKKLCGVTRGSGFPHWLQRVKWYGQCSPCQPPRIPPKAPRHQPCHSCTYGQVF